MVGMSIAEWSVVESEASGATISHKDIMIGVEAIPLSRMLKRKRIALKLGASYLMKNMSCASSGCYKEGWKQKYQVDDKQWNDTNPDCAGKIGGDDGGLREARAGGM